MSSLSRIQHFVRNAPREALADALGIAGFGIMIFAAFTLPGIL